MISGEANHAPNPRLGNTLFLLCRRESRGVFAGDRRPKYGNCTTRLGFWEPEITECGDKMPANPWNLLDKLTNYCEYTLSRPLLR